MKNLLFAAQFLAASALHAQYLNRDQALYDAPSGKTLAQFKDSTQFFAHPLQDNWLKLSGIFLIPNEFFSEEDSIIPEGTKFFSPDLKEVGTASADLKFLEFDVLKGKKYKSYKRVRISGWMFYNRLHRESVPEFLIQDLIEKQRGNLTDRFLDLMEFYPIEKHEMGELIAYVFRAYGNEMDKKPDFQYILIDRGGQPYAVVARGKAIELSKAKFQETKREIHYTYLQKPNAAAQEAVQDLAFSFIKL
jgi:hypothetical protein